MTVDLRPKSTGETLQELAARLYRVEQESSRPSGAPGTSTGVGDNPAVDTITIDGVVVGADASPATGLTLSTGSFMEDIWIDVDWTAPIDGTAGSYDVELARKIGSSYELVQVFHTTGTGLRVSALEPLQTYGVRVTAINRIQVRSDPLPGIGFTDITTGIDATVPGQVSGLVVTSGLRTIVAKWAERTERDVARGSGQYEVQISLSSTHASGVDTQFTTGTIVSFGDLGTGNTYYVRVRAVDNSGNAGAWSLTQSATTGQVTTPDLSNAAVTTAKLANLAVDNSKLALLAVDAANISNGAITNSKLGALAVEAANLAGSSVTSTKIANLAVGTAAIQDAAINSAKIANLAVGSAAIQALAVGTAHIADASIIQAKIGNLAVGSAQIADLSVTNAKMGNLSVDNAKIANLDAVKITTGTLNADRIAANSLDVNKLTTSTLTSKTITIGAGGVLKIGNAPTTGLLLNDQGIRLYSGGVVKVALDVNGTASFEGNISASTITSSTLTSATINAGTITGATVRSAASGQRVAIEASSLDAIQFYTGHVSETVPGRIAVAISGSTLTTELRSPRNGNDFSLAILNSVTGGNGSQVFLGIFNNAGGQRGYFSIGVANNTDPVGLDCFVDELYLNHSFSGTNAATKLRGSGDYGFLWLYGGGAAATLNCILGLGAGFHVLDGNNSLFAPIQASAFNVASSKATKREIRDEGSSLDRLSRMKVKRYKRKHGRLVEEAPELRVKEGQRLAAPKTKAAEPPDHIRRMIDMDEIGLIAEELMDVVPEAVNVDGDGQPISINLSIIVALLCRAVQELNERVPGRA